MCVKYRRWTAAETALIKDGVRDGMRQMLASDRGRRLDPELRSLLRAGLLEVKLARCADLDVGGVLRRPRVRAVVRVADQQTKETVPFKVSRRGNVTFAKEVRPVLKLTNHQTNHHSPLAAYSFCPRSRSSWTSRGR